MYAQQVSKLCTHSRNQQQSIEATYGSTIRSNASAAPAQVATRRRSSVKTLYDRRDNKNKNIHMQYMHLCGVGPSCPSGTINDPPAVHRQVEFMGPLPGVYALTCKTGFTPSRFLAPPLLSSVGDLRLGTRRLRRGPLPFFPSGTPLGGTPTNALLAR